MTNLPQLDQPESLSKLAYNALRKSILASQIKGGVIYNEKSLANDLGISRTPVREALLELASQGLVTFLPRKGIVVKEFTKRDVEEIFEIRKAIELASVEKIAKAPTKENLARLDENISLQKKAADSNDLQKYMELDRSYHLLFSELTGNRRMVQIVQNIRDMVHLMGLRALEGHPERVDEVLKEHSEVVEAVREGSVSVARELMEHHLEMSKLAVKKTLL